MKLPKCPKCKSKMTYMYKTKNAFLICERCNFLGFYDDKSKFFITPSDSSFEYYYTGVKRNE